MKLLNLLILLTFFSFSSGVSNKKISGTAQDWSGGVCCRKGTNYQLTFKIKDSKAKNISIQSVCLNNINFKEINVAQTQNNGFTYFTLSFNYIIYLKNDPSFQEAQSMPTPSYETCSERAVFYDYKGKNYHWQIGKLNSLPALAYP